MKGLRTFFRMLLVVVIVVGAVIFLITNYAWIFAKTVQGEIVEIERITHPGSAEPDRYAVLLQNEKGKMFTTSAVEEKWGVAKKGYCVIATLYRYPPWDLENGGTFYNARLRQVYRCPDKETKEPETEEVPEAPASEALAPPTEDAP